MSPSWGYKYLLVFVDTFTGRIEAYPTRTEKALEVTNKLLQEVIPWFGLPLSPQSDNGFSFISTITQSIAKALDIRFALRCS